ncbi:hypothetical protein BO70DRAFT_398466 [Aspergillus heteromorphus CBS 117.55]|uniref:Uncharacterized protein n=1 Tax=Aspergillus heteromorphus CBS 117.55 TaxID=1448321 RepID=A0A317VL00_9EURO|nr:uncharacterized protein BO70DRAFT_398466 [Aspergillus heteromorphus CBS 117.55]PWY75054.1 hypothetical protein BO70DRAFT_398466 [Aspergillus heteromorphus CBS 117.55]
MRPLGKNQSSPVKPILRIAPLRRAPAGFSGSSNRSMAAYTTAVHSKRGSRTRHHGAATKVDTMPSDLAAGKALSLSAINARWELTMDPSDVVDVQDVSCGHAFQVPPWSAAPSLHVVGGPPLQPPSNRFGSRMSYSSDGVNCRLSLACPSLLEGSNCSVSAISADPS